jgi:hypothetical protein
VIDLSPMADYIDRAYDEGFPCLVATASSDGGPNLAFKGSFMVFDRDHLAFWERSKGETLAALEENPRVAVLYRNKPAGKAWRFYGVAQLHRNGSLREQIMARTIPAELEKDPDRTGVAVLMRVDRVFGSGLDLRREE